MNASRAPLVEVASTHGPQPVLGELDPSCLHCQLALPIQHHMDRHPEQTREQLIEAVAETLAELIGSSTPSWRDAKQMTARAQDMLATLVHRKFDTFARMRRAL